jgi:hypothetical protein
LHARLDHDSAIIGAVVVLQGRGQNFALGVAGLEYLLKAEQESRVTEAHVSLWQRSGKRWEFIAAEKAAVVHERLRNYVPRDGNYGPYWWISADFMPTSSMALTSSMRLNPDAPF